MSEIIQSNASTGNKGSSVKLIITIVVMLGIIGGGAYGFYSGAFKPVSSSQELPDGE